MENEFSGVMSERTDDQLIKIVTIDRAKYQVQAIEAAETEIEKRKISALDFEKIKEQATQQKTKQEEVDAERVGAGLRFIHYSVDSIASYIFAYVVISGFSLFISVSYTGFLFYILFFGSILGYYILLETLVQKTIGKVLTGTRVVKLNGDKPGAYEIIARTCCRIAPFDPLSYIFFKNGFHDTVSKTRVVKDPKK